MSSILVPEIPAPGFSFDLCHRNALLDKKGFTVPTAKKTGTTIAGVIYKDGVVLGADTRATAGSIVVDKLCEKIHYLAKNMYCCGAGTAADTEMTTQMISSQLELHRLNTNRTVPVVTASKMLSQMLFRYQGHIGAALVLGGVDHMGPHLYAVAPHGSCLPNEYTTMGSGSLAAMAVFESKYRPNMEEEEAKQLVFEAIKSGVINDLGSGSTVDLCVIRKNSVDYLRPYDITCNKGVKEGSYKFKKGTTAVLTSIVRPVIVEDVSVRTHEQEPMDI